MKFQPKSDEQLAKEEQARTLWEKGIYSYEIISHVKFGSNTIQTCDTVSKKGNDMLVLVVKLFNDDGRESVVVDYITGDMGFKFKHVAYANGLGAQYDAGELNAIDFVGKCGKAKVGISKGKPKDDGSGNYPDKNCINDYLVDDGSEASVNGVVAKAATPIHDDSIPF